MSNIIDQLEKEAMKESLPEVNIGDTIIVSQKIVEGKKAVSRNLRGCLLRKKTQLSEVLLL